MTINSRNHKNSGEIPLSNLGTTSANHLKEITGDIQGGILEDFQEEFRENPKESLEGFLQKSISQSFLGIPYDIVLQFLQ